MTEFLGFPVQNQTRTLIIDLIVAMIVIALIILPQYLCKVTGRNMRHMDQYEQIYEKHRKELLEKQKEKEKLLRKEREERKKRN